MEFFEDLIAAALRQPRRVVPSAWLGHIPFAFYVVSKLRPSRIVELGAHNAASFAAFCQAFHEGGLAGDCIAVDTWEGDIHAGRYDSKVFEDVRAFFDSSGWPFAKLMRCTFDDALDNVPDGSVDLLHIDGLHTLEAVTHDFETWKPKLSERGVVIFHDIAVKSGGFGVHLLWERLAVDHPFFRFDHAYGLGVLGVGPDQAALASLFEAQKDAARAARVRQFFQYAGDRIALQQITNEKNALIAALRRNAEGNALVKAEPAAMPGKVH
ncbi:class I SAM-dependent methyltransferase [Plastoroseomonas arctica]|uniref:Class I SAM-dependent methyltransferase n=1 Tax=Plastoroseomonas arctica TaxID=1509237 RepID=A0AAF1K6F3_9PROT|nr:class I SAM-dependent methyltransferase [Plastoroseomonas arctica]MBR0657309.1 class I SAM-dependent methyltransferase [Plastoroseomonas arctica]